MHTVIIFLPLHRRVLARPRARAKVLGAPVGVAEKRFCGKVAQLATSPLEGAFPIFLRERNCTQIHDTTNVSLAFAQRRASDDSTDICLRSRALRIRDPYKNT